MNPTYAYGLFSYSTGTFAFGSKKIEGGVRIIRGEESVHLNYGNYYVIIEGKWEKIFALIVRKLKENMARDWLPANLFFAAKISLFFTVLHLENYFMNLPYVDSLFKNSHEYYYGRFGGLFFLFICDDRVEIFPEKLRDELIEEGFSRVLYTRFILWFESKNRKYIALNFGIVRLIVGWNR
jgi:hypothetical protein